LLTQPILAQNIGAPATGKKKTKMALVFMYPFERYQTVDTGGDQWFTWPGNQFEMEKNRERYTKNILDTAKKYDMDIDLKGVADVEVGLHGVIFSQEAADAFVAKTKADPPDALIIFSLWNRLENMIFNMAKQLAPLSIIVYHPVGSHHQHPPMNLMTAPNVLYIHSRENWEILENAMITANAKKMMTQSRLLRVSDARDTERDKNLGTEIISAPAEEYNDLFDSIKPDDDIIREAMAFKTRAVAVIDVEDKYFIDGFRARKTVLDIMKRYNADAITIRCLMLKERKPCIGFSLCNSALIPCACEDFPDSAMSLMIGAQLFRRGGFQHNPEFDIDRNQYYGAHCTCALKLNGPDKAEKPFRIRPFTHQLPKTAAIDVQMTPGEKILLMKYIPPANRIFTYTGTMVGSPEINTAGGCATRFVMDVDKIDDVCSIYHGAHPIMYCASAMEARRVKAFAKLAQLEFVGNV
jgi:hypothetical protein